MAVDEGGATLAINGWQVRRAVELLAEAGAREVYVFGSVAREQTRPESDLDLAVRGLPPARYYDTVGRLLMELGINVDLIELDQPGAVATTPAELGAHRRVA